MINFIDKGDARASMGEPDVAGMRVLLVEDNAVNIMVATGMLRRFGCDVEVAGDGKCGVEKALTQKYDLVLMDLHMPLMDGYEATKAIRHAEKSRGGHTPIVAVTATSVAEAKQRCEAAGMDGYISKPFRAQHVEELLYQYGSTGLRH